MGRKRRLARMERIPGRDIEIRPHGFAMSSAIADEPASGLPRRSSSAPIRAWRKWNVIQRDGDFLLYSLNQQAVWDGPILRADGKPSDKSPFDTGRGHHGIYAWRMFAGPLATAGVEEKWKPKTRSSWMTIGGSFLWSLDHDKQFCGEAEGEVELIGKVVVHEIGYRAEAARVVSLHLRNVPTEAYREGVMAKMEARYQCSVGVAVDPNWDALGGEAPPVKLSVIAEDNPEWIRIQEENRGHR